MDSQEDLNESRFLSEQINNQQQPTEQQVLEKAGELEIDDLALAKESLTKELDEQWKPYINRRKQIYYINFQEKKAYVDHPVDMEIQITYAIRNNKKIPTFREFSLQQVSSSLKLVQEEINNYQRNKVLNIVYEESEEQSRRDTLQSVVDSTVIDTQEIDKTELEQFRLQMERKTKQQIDEYKMSKENEYSSRLRISKERFEDLKKKYVDRIGREAEQEIDSKNGSAFSKSMATTREDLMKKRHRLQDLHSKELELMYLMRQSQQSKQEEVHEFYKTKRIANKNKLVQSALQQQRHDLQLRLAQSSEEQANAFSQQCRQLIRTKINLKQRLFTNIEQLQTNQINRQARKRYSIFNSEVFPQKEKSKEGIQQIVERLRIPQSPWNNMLISTKYQPITKASLTLRLSKKIL